MNEAPNPYERRTDMAQAAVLFLAGFVASVFGLVWFDLNIMGLGDVKFKGAMELYFLLWSVFYLPAAITAIMFLRRSGLQGPALTRLAVVYLVLILLALEITFVCDLPWPIVLLEFLILGVWFHQLVPAPVVGRLPASLRPHPQISPPPPAAPINFTCKRCRTPIHSVYAQHGRMMACPKCGKRVVIPRKSNAPEDRIS